MLHQDYNLNMDKSNIVVLRKYDDCNMKLVNSYTSLGTCFSIRLSFYHACQELVSIQSKKGASVYHE